MTKYAPLFHGRNGNVVFVPIDQLLFDTKSEARRAGRMNNKELSGKAGLRFEGRAKAIDLSIKYNRYKMFVDGDPEGLWVCPIEGPLYELDKKGEL